MPGEGAVPYDRVDRLGGRDVHWTCRAGEPPAVVLLGGCGVPAYRWSAVLEDLPGVQVVALDRPGVGGTRWPGRAPRLDVEVATLVDLVGRVGSAVVLVAHSMAGLHAEALARRDPGLVAGLVLVDGSVERDPNRRQVRGEQAWVLAARAARAAMAVPPVRPLGSLADRVLTAAQSRRGLFDEADAAARAAYRDPDTVASVIAEQGAYGQQIVDLAAVRRDHPWPRLPVVVLTATGDGPDAWVDDQRRLAGMLGGRHVVVEDSKHLMMIDRPDVIARAALAVRREAGDDG